MRIGEPSAYPSAEPHMAVVDPDCEGDMTATRLRNRHGQEMDV